MAKITDRKLVLRSGEEFPGRGFGGSTPKVCTLVYNTSMFAYQDILCDPASTGLMVLMSYPVIGSTGIIGDPNICTPCAGGLVVREYNDLPSNFRSEGTLADLLKAHDIPAIEGVDTRRLTRLIRDKGEIEAVIVNIDMPTEDAVAFINANLCETPALTGCTARRTIGEADSTARIAVIDCGAKSSIAEGFAAAGCAVTVFPADESADVIAACNPDGIIVAGGAGDPSNAVQVIENIRKLTGRFPVFGIGNGFCMVALSVGAKVARMSDGHRGANRPMRWLESGKVNVSSRNYGWCVDEASLSEAGLTALCRDILDGTVTAAADRSRKLFGTLHYPELCPDTQDSDRLAAEFISMIKEGAVNA